MLSVHRALALIPILSLVATAQTSNWDRVKMLAPGTEIRVTTGNSKPVRGKLESVTGDNLTIRPEAATRSISRPEIRSVSVKKEAHRLRKVLIGMGVGTAAGLGIGGAAANNCMGIACGGYRVVTGGLIGLAGGVVAGLVWSKGEWRQVYAP